MITKKTHPPANEGRSEGSRCGGTSLMLNLNLKALNQIEFTTLWLQSFSRRVLFGDSYQIEFLRCKDRFWPFATVRVVPGHVRS
jgi:hypothetical protein